MTNRRSFLKILGTGVAVASANPLMAGFDKMKTPDRTLKIGVLTPQSNLYPQYPYSFINGLRLGIDQNKALKKQHVEIVNEPNGYGTPFISKQNTQKLLYENNVDLLVGLLGTEVVNQFEDLFSKKKVPFIVCNAGENYISKPLNDNPYLFFNTLNLYQSSYIAGKYATSKYGSKGFIISSLYDSGYDSLYTFTKGVIENGGEVQETYVAKANETDSASKAIARINELQPDFIYVLLSGTQASSFIIQYKNGGGTIPIITTSVNTDNSSLPELGNFANNIESISPWDKNIDNKENKSFCKSYLDTYRAEPDLFSVLGYETGMMIYKALVECKGVYTNAELTKCLANVTMNTPRGEFRIDKQTGASQTPLYKLSIEQKIFESLPQAHLVEKQNTGNESLNNFEELDNPMRTGWLNPYLFV